MSDSPNRQELAELLKSSLGERTTELLMNELSEPDDNDDEIRGELDAGISSLSAHMDQQFSWVRDQFEEIGERFERIDQRFERIDQRFERIETQLHGTDTHVQVLAERLDTNRAKVEALVLREIGGLRGDLLAQTRTLMIGIPSMVAAVAMLVLGLAQFALA
jgi:archaellum component FlaC